MIELRNVHHRFGDHQVLRGIDLSLTEQRIAIVGANGSGKSTLARLLNGLLLPTEGQVLVDGLDTKKHGKVIRRKVGFVFQDPDIQIIMPTVVEDLDFGLKHHGIPRPEREARVEAALAEYGLAAHRHHPAHLLSGGQKQLLAIAAVLITNPTHIIFDEPTTLLDLRNRHRITRLITELDHQVILITHDLELAATATRVIVLDQGTITADGPPTESLSSYIAAHTNP
ncbi:energy-coupling factor ABC transporter ATP-binding protein [Actinokineospora diospyrosa]|uniref:Biotin transport system ATP-binding protein n=1 Tax=Actinokineospora diospyrosa TaxID=103728 RepID=A0ABT1I9W9_9PSEU|nr:ABC transporter ATP-binding protein [Actinokineospora diospyrosa]MCP2269424.1 biotin transport system ATP-binding protein [Actinokineospora diospyrosa]